MTTADPPVIEYVIGSELPDRQLTWTDSAGAVINFASGHTFTLKIGTPSTTTKSSGITGAAAAPNITITLTAGEWDAIPAGYYDAQLVARRTADSKDRVLPLKFVAIAAIT